MTHRWRSRFGILLLSLMASLLCASNARAAMQWADWQAQTTPTSATGVLGSRAITVTGPLSPATFIGGAGEQNFWAAFLSSYAAPLAGVLNAPATSDMIRVSGPGVYTITLSQPVTNPVMAIASLGGPPTPTTFDFGSQPIVLLNQGPGFWGSGTLSVAGNILRGAEGNGVIRLSGTMTSMTFTMPTPETWTGFTIGIDDTVNLPAPPSPSLPPGQVGGLLEWDYDYPVEQHVQRGFVLYRGLETQCDDPAPLAVEVGRLVDPLARTYADLTLLSSTVRACYEVSAYNEVGESPHSNRAVALIADLIPAVPGPITVQALVE